MYQTKWAYRALIVVFGGGLAGFFASLSISYSADSVNFWIFGAVVLVIVFIVIVLQGRLNRVAQAAKEEQKQEAELLANAKIVAEAIAKYYPHPRIVRGITPGAPFGVVLATDQILLERLLPLMDHRANNHRNCVVLLDDSYSCEENERVVSDSIRKTLAILAKRISAAENNQKQHDRYIDSLVEKTKRKADGGEDPKISYVIIDEALIAKEEIDGFFQERWDAFWKVHAAAKAIGEKVYTKWGWHFLYWRPGLGN